MIWHIQLNLVCVRREMRLSHQSDYSLLGIVSYWYSAQFYQFISIISAGW